MPNEPQMIDIKATEYTRLLQVEQKWDRVSALRAEFCETRDEPDLAVAVHEAPATVLYDWLKRCQREIGIQNDLCYWLPRELALRVMALENSRDAQAAERPREEI